MCKIILFDYDKIFINFKQKTKQNIHIKVDTFFFKYTVFANYHPTFFSCLLKTDSSPINYVDFYYKFVFVHLNSKSCLFLHIFTHFFSCLLKTDSSPLNYVDFYYKVCSAEKCQVCNKDSDAKLMLKCIECKCYKHGRCINPPYTDKQVQNTKKKYFNWFI